MDDNEVLLQAFDDLGGSVVQPMDLKLALEKRGIPTYRSAVVIDTAVSSGVLVSTGNGGLRLSTLLGTNP